jgi:hypothetical protein
MQAGGKSSLPPAYCTGKLYFWAVVFRHYVGPCISAHSASERLILGVAGSHGQHAGDGQGRWRSEAACAAEMGWIWWIRTRVGTPPQVGRLEPRHPTRDGVGRASLLWC